MSMGLRVAGAASLPTPQLLSTTKMLCFRSWRNLKALRQGHPETHRLPSHPSPSVIVCKHDFSATALACTFYKGNHSHHKSNQTIE